MKKFIEFDVRVCSVYEAVSYEKEQNELDQRAENLNMPPEQAAPPYSIPSKISLDINLITDFSAVFSPQSMYDDPENPNLDCTEICLSTGDKYLIYNTYEEVKQKIEGFII